MFNYQYLGDDYLPPHHDEYSVEFNRGYEDGWNGYEADVRGEYPYVDGYDQGVMDRKDMDDTIITSNRGDG